MIIENSSFAKGEDKIFQTNAPSTWYLKGVTVNGAGKVLRQNGDTKFKLTVFIDGLKASGIKEAIVRSDAGSNCTVYYKDCPTTWKGSFTKKQWDGKNPSPPTLP